LKISGSTSTSDAAYFRRSFALFEGFQASTARPFDKTSKDAEMNVYLAYVLLSRIVTKHVLVVLRGDVVSDRPHQFNTHLQFTDSQLYRCRREIVRHSATETEMSFDILGYRLGTFEVFALLKRCAALLVVCYRRFGTTCRSHLQE